MNRLERSPTICMICTSPAVENLLCNIPNDYPVGGAEVQLCHLALLLQERGWPVTVIVDDHGQAPEVVTPQGIRLVKSYDVRSPRSGPSGLVHKWLRMWRALSRAQADIYIGRGSGWRTGLIALFARSHGRKSVFWMASRMDPINFSDGAAMTKHAWWAYRYGVRSSHLIIGQTREQCDAIQQASGRRCHQVPNVWTRTLADKPTDKSGVLWVGNMRRRKRPHMLLDIAQALPSVNFTMVGGAHWSAPELFEQLRARARGLQNVHLAGRVPFGEMDQYYARAASLACTSETEGFPNTFLQAWTCGTPVVSTIDPDGVIAANRLGACCGTTQAMTEVIRDILADRDSYRQMQQRCREYVAKNHSAKAVIPRLESVLRNLMDGKEAGTWS